MSLISAQDFRRFAVVPHPEAVSAGLNAAAERFGIDTPLRLAHWLGQMHHESGGFLRTVENLNYSAQRLTEVWHGRFPTLESAQPYAGNPEALANKVYAGRMGNTQPGDGYRFRGRGWKMLTGRDNYQRAGQGLGMLLTEDPDLVAKPLGAAMTAGWFWDRHDLNELADADDIEAITRVINGGQIGLEDRKRQVARAKTIWTPS